MGFLNAAPDDDYRINAMPGTTDVPPLTAFDGLATAIPKGLASAGEKVGSMATDLLADSTLGKTVQAIGTMADQENSAFAPVLGPNSVIFNAQDRAHAAAVNDVLDQWAQTGQDPRETGAIGRIAAGATEGISIGLAGGAVAGPWGAASLLGGTEGHASYADATAQGMDPNTALEQASITGLASAAGAFLPMKFGSTLGSSILGGAGANLALGAAQRASTAAVLDANGYPQQAAQYKVFDGEAMASDAIMGGAFGAFGHFMHGVDSAKIDPADVDTAAAVSAEEHFNRSAPGVPVDPETANLHVQTMEGALKAMADGDLPKIDEATAQHLVANVVPDPIHEMDGPVQEAARAELPGYDEAAAHIEQVALPPGSYPAYRRALESGGRADAANPNSTALGADQFTAATWLGTIKQASPDWAQGLSNDQLLALRTDPAKSGQMAAVLDQHNAAAMAQAGVAVDNHTLYAAHHFGPAAAIDFANAPDDAPMSSILSAQQLKANPYLDGLTKAEALANWDRRAGAQPVAAAPRVAAPATNGELADAAPAADASDQSLAAAEPVTPNVPLDDFHGAMLDNLVQNYPDDTYLAPDGQTMRFGDLADQLQAERNDADSFGKLHDIAAACAARNN